MSAFASRGLPYPFLPTDIQPPEEDDRFRVFLIDTLQKMTDVVNEKVVGVYLPTETFNGELWNYTDATDQVRYGFRSIIFIPTPLPNVGTQSYPHNIQQINSEFAITDLYVAASNRTTLNYRLITGDNVTMDATNVTITTTFNGTGYQAYVVIEYVRNA